MPFTDAVSSISGRNSRSSNVSAMTGASHSNGSNRPRDPGVATSNDMFSNAAILGMLKTSTDTGDIGALSYNHPRMPTMPRTAYQRRGHSTRPSGPGNHPPSASSHHQYAPSQASRASDSTSFARRGSTTSMQSMPPSLPGVAYKSPLQVPPPAFDGARDSRSYSLTSALPSQPLPRHRSSTSLKSAGHQPRHGHYLHPGQVPLMPESRSQYVYPTRLKRPGYRSPSPALSELSGHSQAMPMQSPHASQMPPGPDPSRREAIPVHRPQLYSHNTDYDPQGYYGTGVHQLHVRPPPRAMSVSPVTVNEPHQHGYHGASMRPHPSSALPPIAQSARQPPPRPSHHPMPHQAHRAAQYYGPPRPLYPTHPPVQYGIYPGTGQRVPPVQSTATPAAINMFHNAARMARHLPQRMGTPRTDGSPPSSDPPSSGTAPTSSDPPTPKDQSFVQVAVDPLFIDPAFSDLQDSSSEPVMSAKYFAYADGIDPTVEESNIDVHHPSVPPSGFVQRVRAMLESKAAVESAEQANVRDKANYQDSAAKHNVEVDVSELHELAADHTPRFTIIEEFEAPVELPASPVKVADTEHIQAQSKQRLTRELVKAELAPSDTIHDSCTQIDTTNGTENGFAQGHEPEIDDQEAGSPQTASEDASTAPKNHPQSLHPAPVTEASPEATGISGINYALRFSTPVDTTVSDETQSKDPFVLDADTITLQHQRSKERVTLPIQAESDVQDNQSEVTADADQPVSPLLPGENVTRFSEVSPLQTRTFGIDETLHPGTSTVQEVTTSETEDVIPASPSGDSQPPPTPRTPRTYSKSVQLSRISEVTTTSPHSHRLSLPTDFSGIGETSVNTTSEMVTDMAVRFSLPTTTITIGKPQIITIPPSSSPEKPEPEPLRLQSHRLDPRSARRFSVTFADEVAPLQIKKQREDQELKSANEASTSNALAVVRRASPLSDFSESTRTSHESTTDLRFPTNAQHSRFGSTHLPGLKEESVEDMSLHEKQRHSSVDADNHPFPLPARIAAVKAMQERRLNESAEKAKARRAARHHNRPLAEIKDLPSLNFSRMDLIDKLNEALETRPSKSLEIVRRRDFSGIYCPSPQRPQSTEPLRERYASFFCKPEDFGICDVLESEDGIECAEPEEQHPVPVVEMQESTKSEDIDERASRPLSPEDLLSVATQVNRLSIPSVNGLSEKLTSLLPSLRTLHLDSVIWTDEDVEHTIDDIHQLGHGGGGRRDTLLSSRTSAGFRTLAERAEEIVVNGTHDSIAAPSRSLLTDKELPPLPESASAGKVSAINTVDGKQSYLSGSVSAPSGLGKDLARPPSALLRQKSPTSEDEVRDLLPPEMNPITRTKRSLIMSSASRPWNQDENYPWARTNVSVDLTVPREAHTHESIIAELRRNSKSHNITRSIDSTDTSKGIDIGSITTNLDRTASITTEQATGYSPHHKRKHSKRSIISSLSRKIGLTTCHGDTNVPPVPTIVYKSDESLPHRAGDRYPTSALTPPVAFNIDEVRSFFSDNSSDRRRNASIRKRLTGLRCKGKNPRLEPGRNTSLDMSTTYDAGLMGGADRLGAASSARTYDGVGMGKTEFRIKRFGEKLRHLFAKSGELFRSLSARSKPPKPERVRDDWLSDSLYSGV